MILQTLLLSLIALNCSIAQDRSMSPSCSYHGTYKMGGCECQPEYYGTHCECRVTALRSMCRSDISSSMECSGRGNCVCGVCECNQRPNPEEVISGKFCECDNFSCSRHKGLVCSGHGRCECGNCVCAPGWLGHDCSCKSESDSCIPTGGGEICSGHGYCICGECKCHRTEEGQFLGKFCECNNLSCARHNGLICSGPEHGRCECGNCVCAPGWSGPDCKFGTDGGEICSDHGASTLVKSASV